MYRPRVQIYTCQGRYRLQGDQLTKQKKCEANIQRTFKKLEAFGAIDPTLEC